MILLPEWMIPNVRTSLGVFIIGKVVCGFLLLFRRFYSSASAGSRWDFQAGTLFLSPLSSMRER
ncbi:hypothetical protein PQX70_001938 [Salmonella enterica]|nr:hypothetical protein [Salmonella enterica]EKL1664683.1 hypothetical protein [Salmonella enterica]